MKNRRASLPGADELFRKTSEEPAEEKADKSTSLQIASDSTKEDERRPRHEEKITFYCTADDLVRLERVRLSLRADHKLAADRGRIVRAALADVLDDFETRGEGSALIRRLKDEA